MVLGDMMKIENVMVYGLHESISCMKYSFDTEHELGELSEKEIRIAKKLGKTSVGSGHDCFLKGIIVQFDITAPHYWLPQFQRYHWIDFVMSQSKMHSILNMDLVKQTTDDVEYEMIEIIEKWVVDYKKETDVDIKKQIWNKIMANLPMGLMLKARISTNYMQLKTIYHQRRNHKLQEWHVFCDWACSLPKFKELVLDD